MKSAREWIKQLKPEHRDLAFWSLEDSDTTYSNLADALFGAFDWSKTPQGDTYWNGMYKSLVAGTYHFTAEESAERMATDADYRKLDKLTTNLTTKAIFPKDDSERQKYAVGTFICEFFPHAIAELARFSYDMQQKHNPDAPMGWAKGKSVGDGNQIFRHQMDGEFREVAWRGLEQLERFLTKMEPFNDK